MSLRFINEHHYTKWREWASCIAQWLSVLLLLLLFLHAKGWAQGGGLKPTGQNVQHVICDSGCAAGSGATGIQVRNAGDTAWVNVGFNVANLTLPVTLQTGANAIGSITNTGFNVNNFPATYDTSDRAARLLGIVYGSQSQQLKQTATNFNLQTELATGGTLYDARQIRALTSADTVTANQGTANTAANAWPHKITDGTNTAAVKAASTAALATDPAVVVAVSPNNSVAVTQATAANLNATVTGTVTTTPPANASTNVAQFGGTNVSTGTGVGGAGIPRVTVSNDSTVKIWDGSTTVSVIGGQSSLKTDISTVAGNAVSTSATGVQKVGIVGNAGATLDATVGAGTAPTNMVVVGSQFNTTAPAPTNGQTMALQADVKGNLLVSAEGRKVSYKAASAGNTSLAAAFCWVMTGSATKTVKVTHLVISTSASTAAITFAQGQKFTGGVSAGTVGTNMLTATVAKMDSNDGANTIGTMNTYTAAPTLTTAAGEYFSRRFLAPSATVAGQGLIDIPFGSQPGAKELTLRGTSEVLAVEFGAAVVYDIEVEWTEE